MKDILVVYNSKYGTTKKYAFWIAESLKADIIDGEDLLVEELYKYRTIIYGSSLFAGTLRGFKLIRKNYENLVNRNLFFFAVGAGEDNEENRAVIVKENFEKYGIKRYKLYYMRGCMNYAKFRGFDRIIPPMIKFAMVFKRKKTEEDYELINSLKNPVDYTNYDYVKNLVADVKLLMSNN